MQQNVITTKDLNKRLCLRRGGQSCSNPFNLKMASVYRSEISVHRSSREILRRLRLTREHISTKKRSTVLSRLAEWMWHLTTTIASLPSNHAYGKATPLKICRSCWNVKKAVTNKSHTLAVNVMLSIWQFQLSSQSVIVPRYSSPFFSSTVTTCPWASWSSFTGIPRDWLMAHRLRRDYLR